MRSSGGGWVMNSLQVASRDLFGPDVSYPPASDSPDT
jgi:hypothetical protein